MKLEYSVKCDGFTINHILQNELHISSRLLHKLIVLKRYFDNKNFLNLLSFVSSKIKNVVNSYK